MLVAAIRGYPDVVRALLDAGAKLDAKVARACVCVCVCVCECESVYVFARVCVRVGS